MWKTIFLVFKNKLLILFQCPNNAGSTYYNYKHAHSVVLMAICDAQYIFRFVDIGAYGRRSDGGIFSNSVIGKNFNANRMNVPKPSAVAEERILPYCLVGDEAFPLKSYLLRPYPGKNGLTPEQDIFNYRLSRARRLIENTFGILASQWRIYRKPIIAFPENAKLNRCRQRFVCIIGFAKTTLAKIHTFLKVWWMKLTLMIQIVSHQVLGGEYSKMAALFERLVVVARILVREIVFKYAMNFAITFAMKEKYLGKITVINKKIYNIYCIY
ncbi:protein ALP1-like [Monomorium pharaonis]|uniref:protein ALP1-like n=1 Tax=Monomorium pharaonis TaxID=307658 RepID=UPI001746FC89|nr:protein ALP1-like [Monomorium pharaonis]